MSPSTPSEPAPRSGGLLSIQALRGFAVMGVVLMHIPLYLALRLNLPNVLPQFDVGAAGVDVFFVISGFVMVYASERLFARPGATRIFLLRRVARIVPMYWVATTILLAYLLWQYGDLSAATGGSSWGYVAASYLFFPYVRGDGLDTPLLSVGWTLLYEAFFYLVFGLLIALPRRRSVAVIGAVLCAVVALGIAVRLPYPFAYWFNPIILEFVCGMALALAYRDGVRLPSWATWGLLVAGLAALAWSWSQAQAYGPHDPWRFPLWGLPAVAIVAALTLRAVPVPRNAFWRAFAFLGDASYSLYLFHTLTLTLPRFTLARWIEPASAPWLYVVAMLLAALVPGIVIYLFVEQPLTGTLQRWIEPTRREPIPAVAPDITEPAVNSPTARG
jgi:exopolysaccharide production protein ExoZ